MKARRPPARSRPREAGMALLMVMMVFMVLGVIALDFSRAMRDDAMAGINYADEVRGYYLAIGGMNRELMALKERAAEERGRQSNPRERGGTPGEQDAERRENFADGQEIRGTLGGGQYVVTITDEAGKIPINVFPEDMLRGVLWNLAVSAVTGDRQKGLDRREEADVNTIVDSILDWRDCGDETRPHGAETDYYEGLPRPYSAKNAPFDSPEELLLVRGVTPALFYGAGDLPGLRDVVSVYAKSLNLRTVQESTLRVLFNVDQATASQIVSQRREAGAESTAAQLQALASSLQVDTDRDGDLDNLIEDQEPHTVAVVARGNVDPTDGVQRDWGTMAAVLELEGQDIDGVKPLRWYDRAPWTGGMPEAPALPAGAAG